MFLTAQRCFLFDLKLANAGTTPATDIDAIFTFPEGVHVLRASKVPEGPKAPAAPEVPKNALGPFGDVDIAVPRLPYENAVWKAVKQPWELSTKANLVHLKIDKLKHGFDFSIPQLAILFPDRGVRSISFKAALTATELSSATECELHVVMET